VSIAKPENRLYYGDNLEVLRRHIADESVDLVYLDPPFKSDRSYNVLFKEQNGSRAASQIHAFEDTWTWNQESESTLAELVTSGGRVADCLQAFRTFLGECDMLAYLVMMAPRLVELRRVLKPTGSIYLHCDPAASHYLKMLMDASFGPVNFRSEIVWQRSRGHSDKTLKKYGANHDVILFYTRTDQWLFARQHHEKGAFAPKTHDLYQHTDGKLYRKGDCRAPGNRGPLWTWNGHALHWRFTQAEAQRLESEGRIVYSKTGMPRVLRPVDLSRGHPLQDTWVDIDSPNSGSGELLGYPTQKPVALLERIVRSSCPEGGIVLDPFCGCGTTIAAAQALGRPWIGIDITHLAITLIKQRLKDSFGESAVFQVVGEPVSLPDAQRLAESDPYQFQWWALGLVGARPVEQKKGADKGIDGRIIFQGDKTGTFESVILSVKAGNVGAAHVRDLKGVLGREKAVIGVLISMQEPTAPMRTEAVTAGFHESSNWGRKYPKVQLLTVADLLAGKSIDMPPIRQVSTTFKKAPQAKGEEWEQVHLDRIRGKRAKP
jgi:site-specific DNA-methyltransferase (adenine-specific)